MAGTYKADTFIEDNSHGRLSRSPSPTLIYPLPKRRTEENYSDHALGDSADSKDCASPFPFDPVDNVLDRSQNSLGAFSSILHRNLSQSPEDKRTRPRRRRSSKETTADVSKHSTPGKSPKSPMVTDIDQAMAQMDERKLKAILVDARAVGSSGNPMSSTPQGRFFHEGSDVEETNIDDEPPSAKMIASLKQKSLEMELLEDTPKSASSTGSNRRRKLSKECFIPSLSFDEAVKWPLALPNELDRRKCDSFDGETLVNWLSSEFDESHHLHVILSRHDFRIIVAQFCTHLLSAGVLSEVDRRHKESIFKTHNQYKWTGQDLTHGPTPAELNPAPAHLWPPSSSAAGQDGEVVDWNRRLRYSEHEKRESDAQLKKEFEEEKEQLKRSHEEEMGRIREGYVSQIERLGQQILALQEEVRKSKTLAGIDKMTQEALQAAVAASKEAGFEQQNGPSDLLIAITGTPSQGRSRSHHDISQTESNLSTFSMSQDSLSSETPPTIPPPPSSGLPSVPPPPPCPPPPPHAVGGPPPPPPPPPFSTGGPPPPPPPPGGPGLAQRKDSSKPMINPKSPMKPLFWKRIQVQAVKQKKENTAENQLFWEDIQEEPINVEYFEELFAKVPVESKKKTNINRNKPKAIQAAKVVPPKRSQAVGILLSSLRMEFSDIEEAILNLDTSVLDVEKFRAIYDNRPDEEEMKLIRKQLEKQPDVPLDKPEQFLYDLEQIPFVSDRIFCFIFQSSFQESMTSIDNKLNNLKMTCESLSTFVGVKRIFGLILACGNYMNGGSRTRGQADGFDLEILPKLKDVKGKDNRTSLLQFVVMRYVTRYDADVMGTDRAKLPLPDPSDIQQAGLVNFEDTEKELKKIRKDFDSAESKANAIFLSSNSDNLEPFKTVMTGFFHKGKQDLKEQEENLEDCKKLFDKTCTFFYVKPKHNEKVVTPEHFFSLWLSFCSDFKDIWKKEQQNIMKVRIKEAEERIRTIKESKSVLPATRAKKIGGLKDRLSRQGKI
ncbi:unnamed protein product [Lymnaea stagnalis]|uniref:FH2 domain-containing protein n=1 Tax=Lymnaea stagnalis TaxID=6523 RepID=A0AAV2HVJ3_LYMST